MLTLLKHYELHYQKTSGMYDQQAAPEQQAPDEPNTIEKFSWSEMGPT